MKKIFILSIVLLYSCLVLNAQELGKQLNEDEESGAVVFTHSTKCAIVQNKICEKFTPELLIGRFKSSTFGKFSGILKQILKKPLFYILKGKDPPTNILCYTQNIKLLKYKI